MRVLVTGGLGFLGLAVTRELLAAGDDVTVLTRGRPAAETPPGVRVVVGDVRDRAGIEEIIRAGDFDGVCHLAAAISARGSFADPLTYFDVNTNGTLNLLLALHRPVAFVLTSSSIVYGSRNVGALSEDLDVHPESPYAASKVAAEQMLGAYAATGAIGATVLRCFNIAGAAGGVTDTDTTRIIPNVLRAVTGQLPHMTLNGDGSAVRDFVHVADVAEAIQRSLRHTEPGHCRFYNVGSGVGVSMAEVVATAERVSGRAVPVERTPPKPEPQTLIADIKRAREELGWQPVRSTITHILQDAWEAWRV
ncbi:GDP-mannose 4,6-dehydratase [Phytohabitans rumicis]|uniref:UDP-glucose 4-epimerase n=1 Tax=Phytohabitans rumicis TaxID=1076125 RepID=A0A6V8LDJ3_9ACTN|nr:GDP-mannose 4,6-dehydratase [Phytohabitans rumicis]GFJ90735.1 UDP-glucose 4-epimerase [Phytohabitans rumicis]